jgi:hypothetical protein
VGLIAREIESRGIPTLCMSSAYSITEAVRPPRAVFLDFPLGHTAGRPEAAEEQREIMAMTLSQFAAATEPGSIVRLPFDWSERDDWKDAVMQVSGSGDAATTEDFRIDRFEVPQYQFEKDAQLADPVCPSCVFLSELEPR